MMRRVGLLALLLVTAAGLAAEAPAASDPLIGAYVGRAREVDLRTGNEVDRDIDIVIEPADSGGLRISWVNVTLVDGRRDVPGVKRRSDEVLLVPAPDRQFFLAGGGYDPFQAKQEVDPSRGDPLRWGMRRGDTLEVYSFAILDDGTYELQAYRRRLSGDGLDVAFERVVDGKVVRRMVGHAVRAD